MIKRTSCHLRVTQYGGPMGQRLMRIGERCRPGIDDMLSRHQNGLLCGRRKMRLPLAQFGLGDPANVGHAIGMGLHDDPVELADLLIRPGGDKGRAFHQRQVEPLADRQIFGVARLHAGQFQASRWRIETRVKQRAVALGSTTQDIRAAFQQHAGEPRHREAAQDGKAHHAAADHRNVETPLHGPILAWDMDSARPRKQ